MQVVFRLIEWWAQSPERIYVCIESVQDGEVAREGWMY